VFAESNERQRLPDRTALEIRSLPLSAFRALDHRTALSENEL